MPFHLSFEPDGFTQKGKQNCVQYYDIAGITIQVKSDVGLTGETFHEKFRQFQAARPGSDVVTIHHRFGLPGLAGCDLGREVYRRPPWAIYRSDGAWLYVGLSPDDELVTKSQCAVFDDSHSHSRIYHESSFGESFRRGGHHSLTLFPTDQLLLARILPDRDGLLVHAAGAILNGKGLLFVGQSGAGKSTTVKMLMGRAEILCDDRMIIRRRAGQFEVSGTWSHGEVALVSPSSVPLSAILFLVQSTENRLSLITDRGSVAPKLLPRLVKPLVTADWWTKALELVERVVRDVPCYNMEFDTSGEIVMLLERLP